MTGMKLWPTWDEIIPVIPCHWAEIIPMDGGRLPHWDETLDESIGINEAMYMGGAAPPMTMS